MVRTQVYFTASQHRALRKAARQENVSMTEYLRRLVERHVLGRVGPGYDKEAVMSFIGLGDSGRRDTSERHDDALEETFLGRPIR